MTPPARPGLTTGRSQSSDRSRAQAVEREIFRMRAAWVTVAPSPVIRCSWRSPAGHTAETGTLIPDVIQLATRTVNVLTAGTD